MRQTGPDPQRTLREIMIRYAVRAAGWDQCVAGGTPSASELGVPSVECLSDGEEEVVIRVGGVVAKAHAPDTDRAALVARLRATADGHLRRVLLAPLTPVAGDPGRSARRVGGRWVTVWPAGVPLGLDDLDRIPWRVAGALLAQVHQAVPPPGLPPAGGPSRVARALTRLSVVTRDSGDCLASRTVRRAAESLPPPLWGAAAPAPAGSPGAVPPEGQGVRVCHGDWHLGQLVHCPGWGWRLIDLDDLGLGDPCWDLARPAAWYAAGLLPREAWRDHLGGYLAAGGCAIPADRDPWPSLDGPARAVTVQTAALAVAKARTLGEPLDEVGQILVDCCARMPR